MKIRLSIAVPTHGTNPWAFTRSLAVLTSYLSAGLRTHPDSTLELSLDSECSADVASNRELLVSKAIAKGRTHLLFLDHDMKFSPATVDVLFSRELPIVACNYLIKRASDQEPAFVAVGESGERIATAAESTGVEEVAYCGFGVSLFNLDVFRATPQPWFQTQFIDHKNIYSSEDQPCFARLRSAGFRCFVDHDASKLVRHVGLKEWSWDDLTVQIPEGQVLA